MVEGFQASLQLLIIRSRTLLFRLDAIPSAVCCGNDQLLFRLIAGIFQGFDVVRVQFYVNGVFNPSDIPTTTVLHSDSDTQPVDSIA